MIEKRSSERQPASAFISYARLDGEVFATNLRARIECQQPAIEVWQDHAEMYGVGWWRQIEEALDRARN